MARWPAVLVVLPQVWVVHAYPAFHEAAMATPVVAFESASVALLVDSIAVIAVGWLTVAANLLIAGVLVWLVLTADVRARRQRTAGSLRPRSRGLIREDATTTFCDGAGIGRPVPTPAVSTTPFDRIAPRRAEAGGKPA